MVLKEGGFHMTACGIVFMGPRLGCPLNAIGMTCQHLQSVFAQETITTEDVEEAKELLSIVNTETQVLQQTCDHFLALNRPQQMDLQPTS